MVSGSNFLLEDEGHKILVDCGLRQCPGYCEAENFEPFPYDPASIEAVFLTHAHIDHIGRVPKLYKFGFRGKIFSTPPTKDFAKHLLSDSMRILEREARDLGKDPLYTSEDIDGAMSLWESVTYHKKVTAGGFSGEFHDAGHVLGSSFIAITSNGGKKIIFSGDLGNSPAPLINPLEKADSADYVVIETTYGGRIHEDLGMRKGILENLIEETVKKRRSFNDSCVCS